jgi:hypothetical protein
MYGKINTPNTHKDDRLLSWIGTEASKIVKVEVVLLFSILLYNLKVRFQHDYLIMLCK